QGRKMSVAAVEKIAEGRVWSGVDARRLGLVDHLGGLKEAIGADAKLAGLHSGAYGIDYIEPQIGFREEMLMQLRSNVLRWGGFAGLLSGSTPFGQMLDLAKFNDPQDIYAYCWCNYTGG
ncbi:MAG: signal peptide peptidase SppA, partial [Steroidobacteraceae bacterium]|nr:signal peptide peptidase SppA [Steroidobacteraceae bacterium]